MISTRHYTAKAEARYHLYHHFRALKLDKDKDALVNWLNTLSNEQHNQLVKETIQYTHNNNKRG